MDQLLRPGNQPESSAYDGIADWYDAYVSGARLEDDPFYPTVARLMGPVEGLTICDLACGQGRVSRELSSLGAHVVGVDFSARLLDIARRYESPATVAYVHDDARRLSSLASRTFDGVVCHMALMDIPDHTSTIESVHRVLRPGGWFVFSLLHPCFQTESSGEMQTPEGALLRTVRGYFTEGFWRSDTRPGPPGKVGSYHRMLSTYFNALTRAGMTLEQMEEPRATPQLASARPVWAEVPSIVAARWRKGGGPIAM